MDRPHVFLFRHIVLFDERGPLTAIFVPCFFGVKNSCFSKSS